MCVRHRVSQTLYVSDVIEPHKEPGYGKIVVGTYIAAIQDALDRMQQPPAVSQPRPSSAGTLIGGDNNRDSGSRGRSGPGYHGGKPKGGYGGHGGLQGSTGGKGLDEHDVVLVYHQYGVYDSPFPATFVRCALPFFPRNIHPSRPENSECLTIVLTSEIGQGATGVVHRGTLMPEIWDDAIPMDVVVKLAFDVEQQNALRSEYEIYRHLSLKSVHRGITTALGLFDGLEDGACAFVMSYSGVPLSADLRGNLSISDW